MLSACRSFIKKYNKGKLPRTDEDKEALDTWETFIQENTYFGSLVKPLFDIQNRIVEINEQEDDTSSSFDEIFNSSKLISISDTEQTNDNDSDDSGFNLDLY